MQKFAVNACLTLGQLQRNAYDWERMDATPFSEMSRAILLRNLKTVEKLCADLTLNKSRELAFDLQEEFRYDTHVKVLTYPTVSGHLSALLKLIANEARHRTYLSIPEELECYFDKEKLFGEPKAANVNITLEGSEDHQNNIAGKFFPCPVCGTSLGIRIARTKKPYCVCIDCGIQIFFRGKTGISRLNKILENELLIAGKDSNASIATVLFNRIQHLKRQKTDLEVKQGLIIRDPDLKNAIRAVDIEIERVQRELEKLGRKTGRK